jgi:RNA polymerase sigma-70 factor (ECF subfamily)
LALGLVRDEQDALELVQEAFLRAWRNLERFNQGSSFYTWVYRIVTNLAIDLLRRPQRRETSFEDLPEGIIDDTWHARCVSSAGDPLSAMQRAELSRRLVAALDALPPYHRGVIVMREVDGLSYSEMAEAMGVSKGTIMSRLFHARQKLQRALGSCWAEYRGLASVPDGVTSWDEQQSG